MNLNKTTLLSLIALLSAGAASASPSPALTRILDEELARMNRGVEASSDTEAPVSASSAEDWYFRRFWLRVRAKGGTQIEGFGKLEIVPEIEVLAEHDLPTGWEPYKP